MESTAAGDKETRLIKCSIGQIKQYADFTEEDRWLLQLRNCPKDSIEYNRLVEEFYERYTKYFYRMVKKCMHSAAINSASQIQEAFEEAISEMSFQALKGIDDWLPDKGLMPSSFMKEYAKNAMLKELRKIKGKAFGRKSRVSVDKINAARDALKAEFGDNTQLTPELIAQYSGMKLKTVEGALNSTIVFSIYDLSSKIKCHEPGYEQVDDKLYIAYLLSKLKPIHAENVRLRYGLDEQPTLLEREIAEARNTTRGAISRQLYISLTKMREYAGADATIT